MENLAGDWWASSTFWQFVITTAVALLIGWLSAWATFRASNPKRKLNWWVESNTPLISLSQFSTNGGPLTVSLGPTRLDNPRIVELRIANQGRRDITAAMFHGNQAIRFSFGTEVHTILDVASTPSGSVRPDLATYRNISLAAAATRIRGGIDVKPSLLMRGQVITITVLVDGDENPVKCESAPLVDVKVVSDPPGTVTRGLAAAIQGTTIAFGPLRIGFF